MKRDLRRLAGMEWALAALAAAIALGVLYLAMVVGGVWMIAPHSSTFFDN